MSADRITITSYRRRPNWDFYFMEIARTVATRSTCPRRSVGAIIVRDKRILATGYNGAPSGQPHCDEVGCLMEDDRCIRTIHAEQNAILQAARYGVSIDGATIHTTSRPCITCATLIAGSGIARVAYDGNPPHGRNYTVLTDAGIALIRTSPENHLVEPLMELYRGIENAEDRYRALETIKRLIKGAN